MSKIVQKFSLFQASMYLIITLYLLKNTYRAIRFHGFEMLTEYFLVLVIVNLIFVLIYVYRDNFLNSYINFIILMIVLGISFMKNQHLGMSNKYVYEYFFSFFEKYFLIIFFIYICKVIYKFFKSNKFLKKVTIFQKTMYLIISVILVIDIIGTLLLSIDSIGFLMFAGYYAIIELIYTTVAIVIYYSKNRQKTKKRRNIFSIILNIWLVIGAGDLRMKFGFFLLFIYIIGAIYLKLFLVIVLVNVIYIRPVEKSKIYIKILNYIFQKKFLILGRQNKKV